MSDLRAKLPFLKKKGGEDEAQDLEESTDPERSVDKTDVTDISDLGLDEVGVEEAGNKSLLLKLKAKINCLAKQGKSKSDADLEEDGEDGASSPDTKADAIKKKRSMAIKVVVVAALAVILLYDEIFPPDPAGTEVAANPSFVPPKRVKKAKLPENVEEAAAPVEAARDAVTETVPESADVGVPEEALPPDDAATAAGSSPPEATATEVEETSVDELGLGAAPATPDSSSSASTDTVDDTVTEKSDDNLTDKILQDLENQAKTTERKSDQKEYIAPPDYEYVGRGLVYNCTGKHWACVDGASYKRCEDNSSGNKFLKKPVECYPFNVYQNQKGCENMQNRMVSSSAKTAFCTEN